MAGKSTNMHTAEVGSITLYELYRSVQDQLRQTMERSLDNGDRSLAGRLDDVLIQQRFWECDIHLKDGALSDLEASDTMASSIIRRYLDEIESLLSKIYRSMCGTMSTLEDDSNHENMSLIYDINNQMCEKVEIFDALAPIRNADARGNGQLRRHLELEYQKLQSQSVKEPQGDKLLRLLHCPEKVQKQAMLDVVAVHGFYTEHKAAEQHALDTWRKPAGDNGRFWLRDDLAAAIPQARIFLYEYDSIQVFEKRGHFVSTANDLLESIRNVRQDDPSSPLLFIAHGLGGMLVLQALVSATNSVIYESIYFSTNGITLFDTPFLPDFHGLRSASRTSKAVAKVASQLILPKNVLDTIYDTDLFVNLAEMKQSESLPQFQIILFLSTGLNHAWEFYPGEIHKSEIHHIVTLNAAHSEVCRFDWSEHDQADLDIVISEIKTLYIKAGSKVPSSQVTRDHNVSDVEESIGEDLGSRSSAKTSNPKASVSKSPWDEELEFRPSFPGKSA